MTFNMCFAGQTGFTDRETIFGLRGEVCEMIEAITPIPLLCKSRINKNHTRFYKNGNRIDHTTYRGNGIFNSKYVYTYDDAGRRMGPKYFVKGEDNLDHWLSFTYGDDGRRKKQEQWAADGSLMFYVIFDYDDKGHRKRMTWYNPDGSLIRSCKNTYDTSGNRICVEYVDARGRREWRSVSAFDVRGNTLKIRDKQGISFFWYLSYDDSGNWTRALCLRLGFRRFKRFVILPLIVLNKLERNIKMY